MDNEIQNKEFRLAKREFRRLSKRELIEVVFELQTLILNLKAKNMELERMLEERGDVILSLEKQLERNNRFSQLEEMAKGNRELLQEIVRENPNVRLWERFKVRVRGIFERKSKNTRL